MKKNLKSKNQALIYKKFFAIKYIRKTGDQRQESKASLYQLMI